MIQKLTPKLTLGPLVYNWDAEKRRDFYFRIADEAPVAEVYLGEVVCSKREPFFAPYRDDVIARLQKGGKRVVTSTLAVMTSEKERENLAQTAAGDLLVEANDIGAVQILKGKPFIVGPHIMALNEGTLSYLIDCGAQRVVFNSEMSGMAMAGLVSAFPDLESEAQIFGRQPLAVSTRCYHARAKGRDKDHCRMACGEGSGALPVETIDKQAIWTIAGTQTLSAGTLVLAGEVIEMQQAGITHFRLAPQDIDMVAVARLYRDLLDGKGDIAAIIPALQALDSDLVPINGFYHDKEGCESI